ncbi:MAG: radical SAM protein [Halioglobus sp.]
MNRPVWLMSMDSEQFNAPPTTTAALTAYFRQNGTSSSTTDIHLEHFQSPSDIEEWLVHWEEQGLPQAKAALDAKLQPIVGFSFYTWNAAEFLELARSLRALLPELLIVAGGPHVQQAEDYLGIDPIDLIFLGEAEISFQEVLDSRGPNDWATIDGLAFLLDGAIFKTSTRARCKDLTQFPSPLEVLELCDDSGKPLYESISYETSRGCPFKCAFCEWGTGAIGSKMYQWPLERIAADWEKITSAGIKDIWLADSNFGALKQDIHKAKLIIDLKERKGLPLSFATSWSKKHSRQVQEIALMLHQNGLLPHYQLALQTLTPEALRLSNRQNMSSNQYKPIAKEMSEQGVPIAAELIWGLPGDNLADFERNLDTLLATFPNINIFGYTLLPGTEFYRRREEYQIEAVPVAGYGKAKGEYVVGCHSFSRREGEEGYFLISAHILLVHGHIMPLTTRFLALRGDVGVSPLLRDILQALLDHFEHSLEKINLSSRMAIYEDRNQVYLLALKELDQLYQVVSEVLLKHFQISGADPTVVLQILSLDKALCPRTGSEHLLEQNFEFNAQAAHDALSTMEVPQFNPEYHQKCSVQIQHPGGVGEILHDADGGSWLRGIIVAQEKVTTSDLPYVAIA